MLLISKRAPLLGVIMPVVVMLFLSMPHRLEAAPAMDAHGHGYRPHRRPHVHDEEAYSGAAITENR